VLELLGSDVSLENGELTERWWHKATDPRRIARRIAELPRLKMNSVSDSGVCGYSVFSVRLPGGWGAFIFDGRQGKAKEGVEGESWDDHRTDL